MAFTALIVDDSQIMREVLTNYVLAFGGEVLATAADGQEAFDAFKEHNPDIVLMDITMPNLDGVATLRLMKKERPDSKILIVSALNDKSVVLRALDAGAANFIHKPITEDAVRAAIEKVVSL